MTLPPFHLSKKEERREKTEKETYDGRLDRNTDTHKLRERERK